MELLSTGKTDRLIKQYEPFSLITNDPLLMQDKGKQTRGKDVQDAWGTVIRWKEDEPAGMPYITEENKVCPDITQWRKYVEASPLDFPETAWENSQKAVQEIDRTQTLVTCLMTTGIFERMHFLMGFEDTLVNLLLEPEAMDELAEYIFQWKMEYAKQLIDHLNPDAILSHDDWGAKDRLFMSREIWLGLFKPRYEKLYSYIHSRGVQVIHHADSYLADIADDLLDCHIDVWQGVLPSNNVPELLKKFNGHILLMGGLDAGAIDIPDWTPEIVKNEVERCISQCQGLPGFIPCMTYGRPGSIFPGVYEEVNQVIDQINLSLQR